MRCTYGSLLGVLSIHLEHRSNKFEINKYLLNCSCDFTLGYQEWCTQRCITTTTNYPSIITAIPKTHSPTEMMSSYSATIMN